MKLRTARKGPVLATKAVEIPGKGSVIPSVVEAGRECRDVARQSEEVRIICAVHGVSLVPRPARPWRWWWWWYESGGLWLLLFSLLLFSLLLLLLLSFFFLSLLAAHSAQPCAQPQAVESVLFLPGSGVLAAAGADGMIR